MDPHSDVHIGLKDFLEEAELDQYFLHFRDVLKINNITQLKYVNKVDLKELGLSKPELRRYKKLYDKYFKDKPYFTKIKELLKKKSEPPAETPAAAVAQPQRPSCPIYTNTKVSVKHIIPVEDITINNELGTGEFGVVQQGTWTKHNQRIQVAIKCLGQEKMNSNSIEFLKEAAVMHSIEHASIVRLYGVVLHIDSLMLVTELAPLRSLLECLKEYTLRESFPVPTLCHFAEQICDGMMYLEKKRLIHRDLAARNILVFNKNKVKISDFGLSRALGVGKDYYQTNYNVNLKLPVAWCAAECITYLKFTSSSDVWAFAVTLWEMFSYGFQPWAAFSGQQILTAIDEPNFQRLERPECCPEHYYATMLECWSHEPSARPKFKDLMQILQTIRPEQVMAKMNSTKVEGRRTNLLSYQAGDKITVVGKENLSKCKMWVGVMSNGACGLFAPWTTEPYIPPAVMSSPTAHSSTAFGSSKTASGLLASSLRSSLSRSDSKRHTYTAKRTIQREMISAPQGDLKHMAHLGIGGAQFGDVSFLNATSLDPPLQIVNPYKPSQDLEEVPLLNPNSPSHLTGGASSTPPHQMLAGACMPCAPPPPPRPMSKDKNSTLETAVQNGSTKSNSKRPSTCRGFMSKVKYTSLGNPFHNERTLTFSKTSDGMHEYQEIDTNDESPIELSPEQFAVIHKCQTDFSQSLMEEMECMFRNMNTPHAGNQVIPLQLPNVWPSKKPHLPSTRSQTLGPFSKKKIQSDVKPMSAHDQKTLETAVALANEITSRSMNDLDCNEGKVPPSPNERSKFTFKFPSMSHTHASQDQAKELHGKTERRNFSQEAQSVPDLQSTITEESRIAYHSLIEQPTASSSLITQIAQEGAAAVHAGFRNSKRHLQIPVNAHLRQSSLCSTELGHRKGEKGTDHHHQVINVLPLPYKGSKPQLVDKTRHIRIHPLVMTPNMNQPVETEQKEIQTEDHRNHSHNHKTDKTEPIYMNMLNFKHYRTREANINTEKNLMKKHYIPRSGLEPDYVNITRDTEDVCDGQVPKIESSKEHNTIPTVIISEVKHTDSTESAHKKLEVGDIAIPPQPPDIPDDFQDGLFNEASRTSFYITKIDETEQIIPLQPADVSNNVQNDSGKKTAVASSTSTKKEETELATSSELAEFPDDVQDNLANEAVGSSSETTTKEETKQATPPQPAKNIDDVQDNSGIEAAGTSSESTKKEESKQATPTQPVKESDDVQNNPDIEAAGTSSAITKKEETKMTESEFYTNVISLFKD